MEGCTAPSFQDHEAGPRALVRPSVGSHVRQEELGFLYPGWTVQGPVNRGWACSHLRTASTRTSIGCPWGSRAVSV
jgi:hypothetical protein